MAAMSDYLESQLIDHIFRTNSFVKPTTIAIALCTGAPTDASTGATIPEVANAGNYSRQTLNPADANWAAVGGGNGTTRNLLVITFPQATANWGTITYVALIDDATYGAGNMFFYGALIIPKTISSGDAFVFDMNNLAIQIDN